MSAVMPDHAHPGSASAAPAGATAVASEDHPKITVSSAIERLALSRQRLREAMLPAPKTASGSGLAGGIGTLVSGLADRVRALPAAGLFVDVLQTWWARHPLRTVALVGAEATRKLAAPVAERNPLMLVLGALIFGAIVAISRPWRWALRPALFAGLLPAVAATAFRELPVESLLRMFGIGRPATTPAPTSEPTSVPSAAQHAARRADLDAAFATRPSASQKSVEPAL